MDRVGHGAAARSRSWLITAQIVHTRRPAAVTMAGQGQVPANVKANTRTRDQAVEMAQDAQIVIEADVKVLFASPIRTPLAAAHQRAHTRHWD